MEKKLEYIPRPTSEEDCSKIVGYRYLVENEMSPELRHEQEDHVADKYSVQAQLIHCGCQPIKNRKCTNQKCFMRKHRVACPANCGSQCGNNPWAKNTFLMGKSTYLKYDKEKGYGIFAHKVIPAYSNIGEYTGRVIRHGEEIDDVSKSYLMLIPEIKHSIDAHRQGSACSRVNHSCEPNLYCTVYVHDGVLKVIYKSKKCIKLDEELTVDYGWTYDKIEDATKCYCGTDSCDGYIGNLEEASESSWSDDEPTEFPMVDEVRFAGSEVRAITLSQPDERQRPFNWKENHIFQSLASAFAVIQENGHLRITGGIIVHCYKNLQGIFVYVIRRLSPGIVEYHLPRWLCFHYFEDAVFARDNLYSDQDRTSVLQYCSPLADAFMGLHLQYELVSDYVARFKTGNIPDTIMKKSSVTGPTAIGQASYELQADTSNTPAVCAGIKATPSSNQSDEDLEVSERESVSDIGSHYDISHRRDFNETIRIVMAQCMARRQFEYTVEQVTILAISRMPTNLSISYDEMHSIVKRGLEHHYYRSCHHQRKFLWYDHYLSATEAVSSGSIDLHWCSLCKLNKSFSNSDEQTAHFHEIHAIIASKYSCCKCKWETHFPSAYSAHLRKCDPKQESKLRTDIYPFILDAYADFMAMREEGSHSMQLCPPGLPLIENFPSSNAKSGHEMNTKTGKPVDSKLKVIPANLRLQTTFKNVTSWDILQYAQLDEGIQMSAQNSGKEKLNSNQEDVEDDDDDFLPPRKFRKPKPWKGPEK